MQRVQFQTMCVTLWVWAVKIITGGTKEYNLNTFHGNINKVMRGFQTVVWKRNCWMGNNSSPIRTWTVKTGLLLPYTAAILHFFFFGLVKLKDNRRCQLFTEGTVDWPFLFFSQYFQWWIIWVSLEVLGLNFSSLAIDENFHRS